MQPAESRLIPRLVSVITLAGIAIVLLLHLLSIDRLKLRDLNFDESEYLHVAWEMHQGQHLYRDFMENHSPFLFLILERLLPEDAPLSGPGFDPLPFTLRARLFAALCGLGVAACAGLAAQSISRSWLALLLTCVGIFAPGHLWRDVTASIRNDPPTLLLFWLGALLILLPSPPDGRKRHAVLLRGSFGVGLIFVVALWSPKWPLCSLVLGIVHLLRMLQGWTWRPRRIAAAVLPAMVTAGAALLIIVRTVPLRDYYFFTFTMNRLLGDWFRTQPQITGPYFNHGTPFLYCSPAYRGLWPVVAVTVGLLLLAVPAFRRRSGIRSEPLAAVLTLVIAAFVEIRFILSYPNLWPQYYLLWGCALAVLYAICAVGLVRLLPWPAVRPFAEVAVVAIALALHGAAVEANIHQYQGPESWRVSQYIQHRTLPGQTIWLDARPIAVHSASYYWFAFRDLVAFAIDYTARHPNNGYLPPVTEADLPICRSARGLDNRVRFVAGGEYLHDFPVSQRCLGQLYEQGRARVIWPDLVYEIRPQSAVRSEANATEHAASVSRFPPAQPAAPTPLTRPRD
jgi:hypothetical protein